MISEGSEQLISLIQQLAEKNTNPVLEALAGETPVNEQKYPTGELHFDQDNWRGFYHCHASPGKHPDEHGHFHLFIQTPNESWAHVAGLSMDFQGQPRQWFTTNQWVTDGDWLEADRLSDMLAGIKIDASMILLEQWLLAMVVAYADVIEQLLHDRDDALIGINDDSCLSDRLKNRDIYVLGSIPVNLEEDFLGLPCVC